MKCNQVLFDKTMFNSSFMSYYYDITVEAEKAKGVFRDISIVQPVLMNTDVEVA